MKIKPHLFYYDNQWCCHDDEYYFVGHGYTIYEAYNAWIHWFQKI